MSAVEVTISGMLYDRAARTQQSVVLIGEAMITGLGVGGGPIIPPPGGGGGEKPPGFWGPHPGFPTPPIVIPPEPLPPNVTLPPPGSPPVIVPGTTPTHPITPPPAVVIEYPGVGKVLVPQPLPHEREPKPQPPKI